MFGAITLSCELQYTWFRGDVPMVSTTLVIGEFDYFLILSSVVGMGSLFDLLSRYQN